MYVILAVEMKNLERNKICCTACDVKRSSIQLVKPKLLNNDSFIFYETNGTKSSDDVKR